MRRLLGGSKPYTGPSLDETSSRLGDRAGAIDKKIALIEQELTKIRNQLNTTRSKVQQDALKKRAIPLLKQKKMYERQRDSLYSQQSNIEQTSFAHNTVKDSLDTVNAMKHAAKQMKKDYKKVNITEVENLQDTMMDLMADANDLQDVLGRAYDTPDYLDDDELLEELDTLEGGMLADGDSSYLDDLALPSDIPNRGGVPQRARPSASQQELQSLEDELGLL